MRFAVFWRIGRDFEEDAEESFVRDWVAGVECEGWEFGLESLESEGGEVAERRGGAHELGEIASEGRREGARVDFPEGAGDGDRDHCHFVGGVGWLLVEPGEEVVAIGFR